MKIEDAVIVGVGLHPFGKYPEKRLVELGSVAIHNALKDAELEIRDIQMVYCGHVQQGMGAGLKVLQTAGFVNGLPIFNMEMACASSAIALKQACVAVASGEFDIVLAVGFEKMKRGMLDINVEQRSYDKYQYFMGLTAQPIVLAWQMRRYMKEFGARKEQFAQVTVKARKNGALHPCAHFKDPLTIEQVLQSRMISDPLTLYQCCPTSDGASAVVVCNRKKAKQLGARSITFAGYGAATPIYKGEIKGIHPDFDIEMTKKSSTEAYEMAGIGPEDVDVVQVHDPFVSMEIEEIEGLGLCPRGEGARYTWEGKTAINGEIPVNTDGGALAFGHPIGATGLRQAIEQVVQLRGEAGSRQVANAKVGLTYDQGIGGCISYILKK